MTALAFVLAIAAVTKLHGPRRLARERVPRKGVPREAVPREAVPREAVPREAAPLASSGSLGAMRLLSLVEIMVAAIALAAPADVSGPALALLFGGFALAHAASWRSGDSAGCQCFGERDGRPPPRGRRLALSAVSAAMAAAVGVAGPPSLVGLAAVKPGTAMLVAIAAWVVALGWRRAFSSSIAPSAVGDRMVSTSAQFLERRFSRRTLLLRVAVAGSALSVAPLRYLLYPGSALAAISPGSCGGGLCADGYTAFCCEINAGLNSCPAGTFPGGWWMCTDYAGRRLCSEEGVRYYVDCNMLPGRAFPGGCHCASDSCEHRRVACNVFRYGQCNTQIGGVTAVACRMVVCENPGSIPALNCSSSVAVDDSVCGHDVPCLEPRAIELAGAGGV